MKRQSAQKANRALVKKCSSTEKCVPAPIDPRNYGVPHKLDKENYDRHNQIKKQREKRNAEIQKERKEHRRVPKSSTNIENIKSPSEPVPQKSHQGKQQQKENPKRETNHHKKQQQAKCTAATEAKDKSLVKNKAYDKEELRNKIKNMKMTGENSDKVKEDGTIPIKLVLVGDGSVGKTSLLISYTTNKFPTDYVPTIFDNYSATVLCNKRKIKLWLWDTAGQEQYGQLRQISYHKADVFLICFSMIDENSFKNALNRWLPEVQEECSKAVKILVGTKSDLHRQYLLSDPALKAKAIPVEQIEKLCALRKITFMPCSGMDQQNLFKVFNTAIARIIQIVDKREKKDETSCQMI